MKSSSEVSHAILTNICSTVYTQILQLKTSDSKGKTNIVGTWHLSNILSATALPITGDRERLIAQTSIVTHSTDTGPLA